MFYRLCSVKTQDRIFLGELKVRVSLKLDSSAVHEKSRVGSTASPKKQSVVTEKQKSRQMQPKTHSHVSHIAPKTQTQLDSKSHSHTSPDRAQVNDPNYTKPHNTIVNDHQVNEQAKKQPFPLGGECKSVLSELMERAKNLEDALTDFETGKIPSE